MATSSATGHYRLPDPADIVLDRLSEADAGDFVSAEAIEEWVASWFGVDELPPPDPDLRHRA
jgi:hypothetical protein